MTEFKVSIIIPVYNAEKYLKKAVDSALMQEETGEVILIEDKSLDNSLKVCEELAKAYTSVHLYQHSDKMNHGAGATRNLGISKAEFDYIGFLDADDYYLPGRFNKDREIFEKQQVDGVYNALGTDYYEEVNNAVIPRDFLTTVKEGIAPDKLFYSLLKGKSGSLHLDTTTVKRKVFEKAGMFDPELRLGQDYHFWIKLTALCRLAAGVIDKPVAMRGVHLQNRMTSPERLNYYKPIVYYKLFQWSLENKLPVNKRRILWKMYYLTNIDQVPRKAVQRLHDAVGQLVKYPFLAGYKFYYKSFPLLSRFINSQEQ